MRSSFYFVTPFDIVSIRTLDYNLEQITSNPYYWKSVLYGMP